MQITITPTDQITELDGVPVRLWDGTTDEGVRCCVMVHRIMVNAEDDVSAFEDALSEEAEPPRFVDLWLLLGSWWAPPRRRRGG